MDNLNTIYRTSSRSYQWKGLKSYVGRIHWYDKKRFMFSESTSIHRLEPIDALIDAERIALDRLGY